MNVPKFNEARPDTQSLLSALKDFQRDTVDYVFEKMYLDATPALRYLVADEVGLGKTLVARGVIARAIHHLWDRTKRIDIVYVCSNSDIARQNISRLNIAGCGRFCLSTRITLLPITLTQIVDSQGERRRVNFISFTPGTSFDLKGSSGVSCERELLYWLLAESWPQSFNAATRVLHVHAKIDGFRYRVNKFTSWHTIHEGIKNQFAMQLDQQRSLRKRYMDLCDEMPRAGAAVPRDLERQRNQFIGELRKLLAQTCLRWLEPDLIILDEFQRFKHLLNGSSEDASEAAQLAEHLFSYQENAADPKTAARVLLLSATPYKMFTLNQECERDDHYTDFQATLDFLLTNTDDRAQLHSLLSLYRDELFRLAERGVGSLAELKEQLSSSLRKVMVRTERLAISSDRNGMLHTVPPENVELKPSDLRHYLALQRVADILEHHDVLEYWKSAPYLLNFMEDYDLKRKLRLAIEAGADVGLSRFIHSAGLLDRADIEKYKKIDPANSRMRAIYQDTIGREAWRLLWIPPSLPYYKGTGPFESRDLSGFTKRLVFSCWRVLPKTVASVLSYEAERCMMQSFRRKAQNTAEARKRRRPLLRFTVSEKRPTGMPVLASIYPCRFFADRCDPLKIAKINWSGGEPNSQEEVLRHVESDLIAALSPIFRDVWDGNEVVDERWYWVAPLLLDLKHDTDNSRKWFEQPNLPTLWRGDAADDEHKSARRWLDHVKAAREVIEGGTKLGRLPPDLYRILARMALAGPGAVCLRALERVLPKNLSDEHIFEVRTLAAKLAHSFLHLFNLPEVMYLLRDRQRDIPYWQTVLDYAVAGNLQSVLDEYMHVLIESLGLTAVEPIEAAKALVDEVAACLSLRTSTAKADVISATKRRVKIDDDNPLRLRTRFAMRFGDQDVEEGTEPTRASNVRAAFNSPFWPFVLATTSVGQEGLDFHPYCHAVVHWNLPSNPVDLEQREGRIHRYKGHAVRRNIAAQYSAAVANATGDPWEAMFDLARASRADDQNDLFPFWVVPNGASKIERHIPSLPHSKETVDEVRLRRSLVLYRMVFGQNRQEELVEYLLSVLPPEEVERVVEKTRIDLSPPARRG